jgi:hypothetical protein
MATITTAIKITSLADIGNQISPTTVIPVVNLVGMPTTQKANIQITGNLILAGAGTANFVPAGLANLAYSVTNAAQPNITSVGTLVNLSVTGNVATGNINSIGNSNLGNSVTANYFIGNGSGIVSVSSLSNGTSNVIVSPSANVTISSSGNANVVVVTGTGAIVSGNLRATSLIGNSVSSNNFANLNVAAGASSWMFTNTGNLVLPGNTWQVNYANGTLVPIGGSANTGNIGFDNDVIYSNTGVVVNNSDLGNGQTAGMAIPAQGSGNTVSLYNTYGNVTILAGNVSNSESVQSWIFETNGNLSAPGSAYFAGQNMFIGPDSDNIGGLGGSTVVISSSDTAYVQAAIVNVSDIGSADWTAYGHLGNDLGGWIDMGFNSAGYNDANYTITGQGDGAITLQSFYDGQAPGGRGGNLILATGENGTTNDIVFGLGGFLTENTFARMSNANNALEFVKTGAQIKFADSSVMGPIEGAGTFGLLANANSSILLETSHYDGATTTGYTWEFDDVGNMTLPNGTVIGDAVSQTIQGPALNSNPTAQFYGQFNSLNYTPPNEVQSGWLVNGPGIVNGVVDSVDGFTKFVGIPAGSQQFQPGFNYTFSSPAVSTGTNITANNNTWTFGNDSSLRLPSVSSAHDEIYSTDGGASYVFETRGNTQSRGAGTLLQLNNDSGFATIQANFGGALGAQVWSFNGETGNLVLPANGVINNPAEINYNGGVNIQVGDLANATVQSPGSIVGSTYNNSGGKYIVFNDSVLHDAIVAAGIENNTSVPVTWSAGSTSTTGYVFVKIPYGGAGTFAIQPVNPDTNQFIIGDWIFPATIGVTIPASVAITAVGTSNATWNFGSDGNTTFPDGTVIQGDGSGIYYPTNNGWNLHRPDNLVWIGSGTNVAYIDTYSPNVSVRIRTLGDPEEGPGYDWIFDPTGNLTLPTNTFSVNYANGQRVQLGGGANLGNFVFPNPTSNTSTITVNDGSDIVINPTYGGASPAYINVPGNINGPTGEALQIYNGYYVGNADVVAVSIGSSVLDGITIYGDGRVATSNTLTVPASDNGSIVFSSDGTTNNGSLKVDAGLNMTINANSNFYVKQNGSDRLAITTGNTDLMAASNVVIHANKAGTEKNWIFDTTGNLTTPGTITIGTGTDGNISSSSNVNIIANNNTWSFVEDGNLTTPGEVVISSNNAHGGVGYAGIITMTNTTVGATNINKYVRLSNVGSLQIVDSNYGNTILDLSNSGNLLAQGTITGSPVITPPVALGTLTAVAGARAFVNDGNLVASGNFGAQVGNGGSNTVPVWSDGSNWYIG